MWRKSSVLQYCVHLQNLNADYNHSMRTAHTTASAYTVTKSQNERNSVIAHFFIYHHELHSETPFQQSLNY